MASIVSTTFAAGTPIIDQGISLVNEDYVRPLPAYQDWVDLQIALRCQVNGISNMATTRFGVGVCHGKVAPLKGGYPDTVTNFLGLVVGNTWTYSAGPPDYFTVNYNAFRQQGGTAASAGAVATNVASNGVASSKRTLITVIIRRSPFYVYWWNTTAASADANFEEYMDFVYQRPTFTPDDRYFRGALMAEGSGDMTAATETPGNFDHLNISWNHATQAMRIYDLAVRTWA